MKVGERAHIAPCLRGSQYAFAQPINCVQRVLNPQSGAEPNLRRLNLGPV